MRFIRMLQQYRIYRKMATGYILIVFFTLLIITIALYNLFNSTMERQIASQNISNLEQVEFILNDLYKRTNELSRHMMADPYLITVMFDADPGPLTVFHATRAMRWNTAINPYISWMGIYSSTESRIYSTTVLDSISEQMIAERLYDNYKEERSSVLLLEYNMENERSIGFVRYSELSAENKGIGAIVITISPAYISDLMRYVSDHTEGRIMLLNAKGVALAHSSQEEVFTYQLDDATLSAVTEDNPSGYFFFNQQGVRYLVTYVRMQGRGWLIVDIQAYSVLQDNLRTVLGITIALAVAMFILGIFILLLAGRAYQPLAEALSKSGYASRNNTAHKDEVTYILGQLSEQRTLENVTQTINPLVREALFLQLITDWQSNEASDVLAHFDIWLVGRYYLVILFSFDQELPTSVDVRDASADITERLRHLAQPEVVDVDGATLNITDTTILMQLSIAEFPEKLPLYLDEVQAFITEKYGQSISCAVGEIVDEADAIPESYQFAQEKLSYRFFEGYGCKIISDHIMAGHTVYMPFPAEEEERLISAVKSGDKSRIEEALNACFSHMRHLSPEGAILFTNQLLILLMRANSLEASREEFSLYIKNIEAVFKAQQEKELITLLNGICLAFASSKSKEAPLQESNPHVLYMNQFIEDNYANPDISLQSVADALARTTIYLGRLYRTEVGHSFSESLNRYRMSKAAELMLRSDSALVDISKQVGITNVNYFFTLFKRMYGCTPQNFRRKEKNAL